MQRSVRKEIHKSCNDLTYIAWPVIGQPLYDYARVFPIIENVVEFWDISSWDTMGDIFRKHIGGSNV